MSDPKRGKFIATRILNLRGTAFAGAGIIVDVSAALFVSDGAETGEIGRFGNRVLR